MYHLDNTSGVPEMPEPKDTQTISTRWFGESQEQGGISWPGADWFNIVQAELLAILELAGTQPDKTRYDQIAQSIRDLSDSLRRDIYKDDGLKFVGQCPNITSLREVVFTSIGQQVFLQEHTSGQGAGGGTWYCHSLEDDNSYIDDNGCQIVTNSGQVLRRKDLKHIHSSDFGVMPNTVVDEAYANMAKAMRTFNKYQVLWADPGEGNGYFTYGAALGINHRKGVRVTGEGSGLKSIIFWHIGNSIGLRIYKDYKNAEEFWVKAIVENIAYVGVNSETDLSANMNPKATPFEFSDMWEPEFQNCYVGGYGANTEGAAVSIYNKTAWTEGFYFDRGLMVRQSCVGLWIHRDTSEGTDSTNSAFAMRGTLCMNAGVGYPVTYVKVGDGTKPGSCVLYGHDIKIIGWMSRSSWHTGLMVTDHSKCSENGKFTFVWDGYGITSSATTEVLHLIRCQGLNSLFESDVDNYSGQGDAYPLSMRNLLYQTCMYSTGDSVLESSYLYGAPVIQPRGLKIKMKGTFTAAQRQTGQSYLLNNLIPGQVLAVTLRSWANDSKYKPTPQRWIVEVRGPDDPCIVTPNLAATPTLVGSVLTTPLTANAVYGSSLTLNNGNADNNVNYAVNSGRKINFVLPALPGATLDMPYSVTIEVL